MKFNFIHPFPPISLSLGSFPLSKPGLIGAPRSVAPPSVCHLPQILVRSRSQSRFQFNHFPNSLCA